MSDTPVPLTTSRNFSHFRKLPVLLYLLLEIFTLGLFSAYWNYSIAKKIGKFEKSTWLWIWCSLYIILHVFSASQDFYTMFHYGWNRYLDDPNLESGPWYNVPIGMMGIINTFLALQMSFIFNRVQPLQREFSIGWPFLFGTVYIQYRINRQIKWEKRMATTSNHPDQAE